MYYHMACRQPQDIARRYDVVKKLEAKFGQESPLVTSQGKKIEYLGMCINYTAKGKVKI